MIPGSVLPLVAQGLPAVCPLRRTTSPPVAIWPDR